MTGATEPSQALPIWVELVKALAWPIVALMAFALFRRPLLQFCEDLKNALTREHRSRSIPLRWARHRPTCLFLQAVSRLLRITWL